MPLFIINNATLSRYFSFDNHNICYYIKEAKDEKGKWYPINGKEKVIWGYCIIKTIELSPEKMLLIGINREYGDFETEVRVKYKMASGKIIYSNIFKEKIDKRKFYLHPFYNDSTKMEYISRNTSYDLFQDIDDYFYGSLPKEFHKSNHPNNN